MTLRQFVKREGGPERAAVKIGVSGMTVRRWLDGERRPNSRPVLEKLETLGIAI